MVDEQGTPSLPESSDQKLERLARIEASAKVFATYFDQERDSKIDPDELAKALTFVERLNWRTMALTLLRVHKRAAESEEILAAARTEVATVASRLFEIARFVNSATRQDLDSAIVQAAARLTLLSSPDWKPMPAREPAPPTKAGETVAPAQATAKPEGLVLTPDPLSIDTNALLRRGARIAAEQAKGGANGGA